MSVGSWQNMADLGDVGQTLATLRILRKEMVQREIFGNGRIDVLASHLLGYQVKSFHLEMIRFQEDATDTCEPPRV